MNGITLDGTIYILESADVVDDTTPHNYDELINIGDEGDLDSWLGRIQAEWPDLPEDIKRKIVDSTEAYIGKIDADSAEFFDKEALSGENVITETNELDEATDASGNEMYDFAKGKQMAASLDDDALVTVRKELIEVIRNQEDMNRAGHKVPKLGYYWDEYWTVADEISRRIRKGSEFNLNSWSIDGKPVNDRLHELGE